jgi:hypothetical protein
VVETGSSAKNQEHGPSLGLMAIMGKALNDQEILQALLNAKDKRDDLYNIAKDKAGIALNDSDLDALLKGRTKQGRNIIKLLERAKDSLKDNDAPDPKICC